MTEFSFYNPNLKEQVPNQKLDALIVLGHNIMPGNGKKAIISTPGHISLASKFNVYAAGILYQTGKAKSIIFSSGHTSGPSVPSEAAAMDQYWQKTFPHLKSVNRIHEDKSIDTAGNARHCYQIVKQKNMEKIGLVSIGLHVNNAVTIFRRFGHKIEDSNCFASENVFAAYLKLKNPHFDHGQFHSDFDSYSFLNGITLRETIRKILINTIDPKGILLHEVTKRTRK